MMVVKGDNNGDNEGYAVIAAFFFAICILIVKKHLAIIFL
jgi:hypothetical protein